MNAMEDVFKFSPLVAFVLGIQATYVIVGFALYLHRAKRRPPLQPLYDLGIAGALFWFVHQQEDASVAAVCLLFSFMVGMAAFISAGAARRSLRYEVRQAMNRYPVEPAALDQQPT